MDKNEEESKEIKNNENDGNKQSTNDVNIVEILPGYTNFDDYMKNAFSVLKDGIKAANSLPTGDNFNYYACFPKFNAERNKDLKTILNLMQNVVKLSGAAGNMKHRDVEERFDLLTETNDIFLDRAGICMDEDEGKTKQSDVSLIVSQTNKKNVFGSWNATVSSYKSKENENASEASPIRLLAARNISRPQLSFKDKIDNSSKPWLPRIKNKPNALRPLALYVEQGQNGEVYSHPYDYELEKFEPPENQMAKQDPVKYKDLEETPLIVIEKPQDIKILLDDLQKYNEIAIDLEHHSYRTFQGITCLMQISTRDTDYLIDTLQLRSELHVLNEVFTKPSILKVFHGADSDIHWLQRDLSLYIVNMFDTYQAARQLGLPYLSLSYLMKRYCSLDPNKHFQLADWRIRPLPEELMKYAREDTHYLLYIKDILRNGLIDSANGQVNILKAVYDRSTEVCKKVYEKPVWNEESYMDMYRKSQKMFNNRQLYALRELHKWRDDTARREDDSTSYVLPNHMLLNIAETLPREMQGILACCNPIPPLVRQNLLTLHKFILKAREQPLIKPILEQDIRQRLTQRNQAANSDVWIYTPHDIPNGMEVRADLPCLLNSEKTMDVDEEVTRTNHIVTVFDEPTGSDHAEIMERRRILRQKKTLFVSPFERYKRVMPMVAAQEEEERLKMEEEKKERTQTSEEDDQSTAMSIERVHEHFKSVVQNLNSVENSRKTQGNIVDMPLSQMHGRKRKRESDVHDPEDNNESKYDVSTPKPSTNVAVARNFVKKRKGEPIDNPGPKKEMKLDFSAMQNGPKKKKKNQQQGKKNQNAPKNKTAQGPRNIERQMDVFSSSKLSKKDQKRANRQELLEKGMLPQKNFDYKSVDFSSFQGGSVSSEAVKSAHFQQQKQKDKIKKKKKKKKQKINGI